MKTPFSLSCLLAALLLAAIAPAHASDVTDPDAPRSLPADGPVSVQWTDPAQFSEIRQSRNRWEARRGDWVRQLAKYLRKQAAARLPDGERLDVTITDIKRAGDFEPWQGMRTDHVRYMRDIYPPRIALEFTLTGPDGGVLAQGARELTDLAYLHGRPRARDNDPLRYDKQLLDDWLRKELGTPAG